MALTPLDISSFNSFRSQTIGNGYNVDGFYGYQQQCWDYCAELWGNIGTYIYPYLKTGPLGYAYECWTVSRVENASDKFDLITNLSDVKRGDVVVLDHGRYTGDTAGHIAFADEDYNGTTTMKLLGQNQVNPNPDTGHVVTSNDMSMAKFLGAFRYKAWAIEPEVIERKRYKFNMWGYNAPVKRLVHN